MKKIAFYALVTSAFGTILGSPASADPLSLQADRYSQIPRRTAPAYVVQQAEPAQAPAPREPAVRYAATERDMGGGFIEFLFGGGRPVAAPRPPSDMSARGEPTAQPEAAADPRRQLPDPKFDKQVVPYHGAEKPGTVIIDTPQRFLFLVQDNGTAVRYGIGVGRAGFTWAGVKNISAKKEWPDWTPPPEMLQRQPDLPSWM